MTDYEDIRVDRRGAVVVITIDREDQGNKLRHQTCLELSAALQDFRLDASARCAILTGAGDKFFCIGGEHDPLTSLDQAQVLPIIDIYQAIDTIPKPVIAAVNGFAVGGGNVLANVCDLTIASEKAVFRQVGPLVGSFDAGYGSWYLEDSIGRKRAKEMWYLNRKYSADEAQARGLVNDVVPPESLMEHALEVAAEICSRSPLAIGAMKTAFSSRHTGVAGQARLAHDQLLTLYLTTEEAHEVSDAFTERRAPDEKRFWK